MGLASKIVESTTFFGRLLDPNERKESFGAVTEVTHV